MTPIDPDAGATTAPMRIARFLAGAGIGSRRGCEGVVQRGEVTVNGAVCTDLATRVVPGRDTVVVAGRPVALQPTTVILLNKPPGYTCSARDRHARRLVFALIPERLGRLFTVGRLDRDSEGLLILTNDGQLAQLLGHPRHGIRKEYLVTCRGRLPKGALRRLRRGIRDGGEDLRPIRVDVRQRTADGVALRFVLGEGRKREIRRLCRAVGVQVMQLRRVRLGPIGLGSLKPGAWRRLTAEEIAAIRAAATQ